jgi:ABC-type spermidine/putrescine transport system permease subunit I
MSVAAVPANARAPAFGWERYRARVTMLLLAGPLVVVFLLFVVPMAELVSLSLSGDGAGISLAAYSELLRPVYARLFLFTIELGLVVTILCLALGYPIAYLLAHFRSGIARWLLLALFLALWLSVLVRTYGWIIILQRHGALNTLLLDAGLIRSPFALVYNSFGVYVGMVHLLLPFMVITLAPALRTIDTNLIRAALSLGASPLTVFWRIYFPLSLPGAVAASMLVFGMALGFFITPAILGGGNANTIAMAIKDQVQVLADLRLASATSVVLLVISLAILAAYERTAGLDRLFSAGRP